MSQDNLVGGANSVGDLESSVREAIYSATRGSGRLWDLTGPNNVGVRQKIMSFALGRKVTKAESGINALEEVVYDIAGITGDVTRARKQDALASWVVGNGQLHSAYEKYKALVKESQGAMTLMKVGDFYEVMGEDAKRASDLLFTTYTSRNGIPMTGVAYHSLDACIRVLTDNGISVAVAEPNNMMDYSVTRRSSYQLALEDRVKSALYDATRGSCRMLDLAGPHNVYTRQKIMTMLSGREVPKPECGINALAAAIYGMAGIPDNATRAAQQDSLITWVQSAQGKRLNYGAGALPDGWLIASEVNQERHNPWGNEEYNLVFEKMMTDKAGHLCELSILWNKDNYKAMHGGVTINDPCATSEQAAAVAMKWAIENGWEYECKSGGVEHKTDKSNAISVRETLQVIDGLLDSVEFVREPGDTDKPMAMLRDALAMELPVIAPVQALPQDAQSMRQEALRLLESAQALDGLKPYLVVHDHESGQSGYMFWSDSGEPSEEEAIEILNCAYEEDRGEGITILDDLSLRDLTGANVLSQVVIQSRADEREHAKQLADDSGLSLMASVAFGKEYRGKVVWAGEHVVLQSIGLAAVLHDRSTFKEVPQVGVSVVVRYDQAGKGVASVSAREGDTTPVRGR